MFLGENFLESNQSHTSFGWYSSCSKIPILWEGLIGSIASNTFVMSLMVINPIAIGIQISLFMKKRQLQKQRADGIMVITYNRDGVSISSRARDQTSCHKLWRYNRTVVSPQASLCSFLISACFVLVQGTLYFGIGNSGPSLFSQFITFTTFPQQFFLCTFIETIFSPTLRNSLPDFIPCFRRGPAYHVVNV